ncbi:unnamed protein product [Auanema sp. JU1783]|nr:unnamed protein product [Auanema sp. JU1783]
MSSGVDPPSVASGALVVPLIIWGAKPPEHKITCINYLSDCSTIVTGGDNGHVIIWKCTEDAINPHQLMVGHTQPITAISTTSKNSKSTRFISASADGHVCLWDIQDGRCVDSTDSIYVHRQMEAYTYKSRHVRSTKLFCIGDYADFVVMDPQDLTIVFNLSSRVEPDWICRYCFVQRPGKPPQCIGLSAVEMIKIWSLVDLEKKDLANPLYEDESKRLDIHDVRSVSFNTVNDRILLVVTGSTWQIIDLDDLSTLLCYECPTDVVKGQVIDIDKVAIAYNDQTVRVYQLPLELLNGPQAREAFGSSPSNYFGINKPFEIAVLEASKSCSLSWVSDVYYDFSPQSNNPNLYQVVRGTCDGKLLLWKIPEYAAEFMQKIGSSSQLPLKYKGTFEESLESVWSSLMDEEKISIMDPGVVTASLLVGSQGKLILGQKDGLITMSYACEALSKQLLNYDVDKTTTRVLRGHSAAVRSLFYPHEHHNRFDPQLLLSGSDDFTVIVWNINNGNRLHRFYEHGGPVLRFVIPPVNCTKNIAKCVCSITADNTASLLNIRDFKCALLASKHPHPIKDVKWRPLDDFMLVKLDDGSVYVWSMESANLDRIVTGLVAEEVLSACDEQIGREEGCDETVAPSAILMMRALKNKSMEAFKQTMTASNESRKITDNQIYEVSSPIQVDALPGCEQGAHLIQFEVGALVAGLLNVDASEFADGSYTDKNEENGLAGINRRVAWQFEANLCSDVARLMLSLLHGWNLDEDLDSICSKKLGLSKPRHQLYFGNISRHGQLAVALPQKSHLPYDSFSINVRWQASHSLTTTHLLAVIATANTLMGMKNLFIRNRKTSLSSNNLQRQSSKETISSEKQQLKQGWSLVAALHCVLLPDHVKPKSSYAAPRIELLARRWQDSSMEIRIAAQALLVRELARLGAPGRRKLIESWAPFLPPLLDPSLSIFGARLQSSIPNVPPAAPPIPPRSKSSPPTVAPVPEPATGDDGESGVQQVRRNQATAIILLGVVGAEFGDELYRADLTRATALSLLELLVAAPSALLPVHSPLRRAAIDLLGKGIVYWQPHLEISKVLLGLLDLAANSDKQPMPSMVGTPLSPIADACRTARHALSLIANARAPALLTALSMEVARYNSAAQHQTIQHTVVSPLLKSRSEVLRIIAELSEKKFNEVVDLMTSVGEILVHCLDISMLRHKSLAEIFPAIAKFPMVSYCSVTRRIAFGGSNGYCVVHELRASKTHNLQCHSGPISAVAFSDDGKYLATYGASDGKVVFFQTSQTFLGIGQNQMKLVKSQPAPSCMVLTSPTGQTFRPKLVWINSKSIALMMPEGKEQRFTV